MSLLQPVALGFLALIPLIILFYILRAKHRQRRVPSVRFWLQVPSDLEGRPAWRMPLTSLLLFLQILTALILIAALVRPAVIGGAKRYLIVVLDASASMQATDVLPTRFDEAKSQARRMIDGLSPGDEFSLIRAGRTATLLVSGTGSERTRALTELGSASPISGSGDVVGGLALAASLAEQRGSTETGARSEIVVFSDGVFPPIDLAKIGKPRASVRMVVIGDSDRNVAIAELSVRPVLGTVGHYLGYVRTVNYSTQEMNVPLTVLADGVKIEARELRLPPRGQAELTLTVPTGAKLVEARLDSGDYLPLDDRAIAPVGTERQIQVLAVTANPTFWDHVFKSIPMLKVTTVEPDQYDASQTADVTVFDGFTPAKWPVGNVLFVNPVPGGVLDVEGVGGPSEIVHTSRRNPLLDSVELNSVILLRTVGIKLPDWAQPVAETNDSAVIFSGLYEGHRAVVYAFDPMQSDLPQRIAFPVLMSNTLKWLTPSGLPSSLKPGDLIDIQPLPAAKQVIVGIPDGRTVVYSNQGETIRFAQTDAIGAYLVTQWSGSAALAQHTVVVNGVDQVQSDIRPRDDALGAPLVSAASAVPGVLAEAWPLLAALALAALMTEWWYYCRQQTR